MQIYAVFCKCGNITTSDINFWVCLFVLVLCIKAFNYDLCGFNYIAATFLLKSTIKLNVAFLKKNPQLKRVKTLKNTKGF